MKVDIQKHAGLTIREYRQLHCEGLTGGELARRVGVTPAQISMIETGKRLPSIETFAAIAEELGLYPSGLMALIEEDSP